ncbi:hypothetical protein CAL26_01270 [Bordetella genomosp. 9]|uniref:Response regulatory domain-containing protein n=1 Tax=Bordetella genomosp. 9 TaxID=1416803 RepID=A0A261RM46_9BORD|nr:hypothetical protein CAL26_01270 [Bordetella genomosp. 9]
MVVRCIPSRVLVVDNDCLVLFMMVELLTELGFEPCGVDRGVAAIAAPESSDAFDPVVADVDMPCVARLAVFEAAWKRDANMPVMYVSRYVSRRCLHWCPKPTRGHQRAGMAELICAKGQHWHSFRLRPYPRGGLRSETAKRT